MFSIRKQIPSTEEEIKSVQESKQESPYPKNLELTPFRYLPTLKGEKSNKKLTRVTFDPESQTFSEEVLGVR